MISLQRVDKGCFGSRPSKFPVKSYNLQHKVDMVEADLPMRREGQGVGGREGEEGLFTAEPEMMDWWLGRGTPPSLWIINPSRLIAPLCTFQIWALIGFLFHA